MSLRCNKVLRALPQKPKMRGLEKRLQNEISKILKFSTAPARIRDVGLSKRCHGTRRGCVDLYSPERKLAIELKAVKISGRKFLPASKALYDVGQLLSDAIDLRAAKKVRVAYLVILFVADETILDLKQQAHNKLFLDVQASLHFGQLKREKSSLRRLQRTAIERLHLDKPYHRSCSFLNDAFTFKNLGLGIVRVK